MESKDVTKSQTGELLDKVASENRKRGRETVFHDKASKTLTGHSNFIDQVIFLPNGRLASCSVDKTVKVWDTARGQELFTLSGHTDWVVSLAVLPNGWLASGSQDETIKVWDLEARKEVRTLQGHTNWLLSLRVLKNGNLASCSRDDTINLWDPYLSKSNLLLTIEGHGNKGWNVPIDVLSNGFLVACSREDNCGNYEESTLNVWDPRDGRLVKSLQTELTTVLAVLVLSNDQVAIGTEKGNGTIKIIDLNDQSKTRVKEKAHEKGVFCLQQLSNDNLVSSGQDGDSASPIHSIKVWTFSDLTLLQHIITDHSSSIRSLSISQDETMLASGSFDKTIKLWPIITKETQSNRVAFLANAF